MGGERGEWGSEREEEESGGEGREEREREMLAERDRER